MASVANQRFREDEKRRDADHVSFLKHRRFRWLWIALLLCGVSIIGYALIDQEPRPNGGSWYGYTLGTVGLILIVWLSLLGIRKRKISDGAWSLKAWTSAHVYLGLALTVIGTLHTGFQIGWNVHTLAYVLMLIVIFSGIYGVYAYAALPKALSANRGDSTGGEMLDKIADIDRKLDGAAQPLDRRGSDLVIAALGQDVFYGGAFARLTGAYPGCATNSALSGIPASGSEAEARVHELLSNRAEQLAQIRRHLRIKSMLEVWLFIHIPATIALLAALLAHVISVFYYW
ncbi:MAG: hypothetical protein AAGI28_14740 [Pseudomonadota bacterium]